MDSNQSSALAESIRLCEKLIKEMDLDRERITGCMNGELRKLYLDSVEMAKKEVAGIRKQLQAMLQL